MKKFIPIALMAVISAPVAANDDAYMYVRAGNAKLGICGEQCWMSYKLPREINNHHSMAEFGAGTFLTDKSARASLRAEAGYLTGPAIKTMAMHYRDECAGRAMGDEENPGSDGLPCRLEGHNGYGQVNGITLSLVPELRVTENVYAYTRLGAFYYHASYLVDHINSPAVDYFSEWKIDPVMGIGARWDIGKGSITAEAVLYDGVDAADGKGGNGIYCNMMSITLGYMVGF